MDFPVYTSLPLTVGTEGLKRRQCVLHGVVKVLSKFTPGSAALDGESVCVDGGTGRILCTVWLTPDFSKKMSKRIKYFLVKGKG